MTRAKFVPYSGIFQHREHRSKKGRKTKRLIERKRMNNFFKQKAIDKRHKWEMRKLKALLH